MTKALLKHQAPTVQLSFTVNINADRTLLLVVGLLWLATRWLTLARRGLILLIADAWDWLIVGWSDDWRLICEAVRLMLLQKELSYGTVQA